MFTLQFPKATAQKVLANICVLRYRNRRNR